MTLRECATWLGVPEDVDLEPLLPIPSFRRVLVRIRHADREGLLGDLTPRSVQIMYDIPLNMNGDIDMEWLTNLAVTLQP